MNDSCYLSLRNDIATFSLNRLNKSDRTVRPIPSYSVSGMLKCSESFSFTGKKRSPRNDSLNQNFFSSPEKFARACVVASAISRERNRSRQSDSL